MDRPVQNRGRRFGRVEERAAAMRAEAERWQSLWDEATADNADFSRPAKPRRRWFGFLKR